MGTSLVGKAATLLASAFVFASAGWFARDRAIADEPRQPAAATTTTPSAAGPAPLDRAPLIAVSADGNVTLRVEQQPLEWVLEQIAAQSGWSDLESRARPVAAASAAAPSSDAASVETTCAPPAPAAVDAAAVLRAIESGTESGRFDGLLQARSEGIVVPEAMLRVVIESDPSDRVRLAALDSLLESRVDERLLAEALQAASHVPNDAIQREAKRRLDEWQQMERIDAQLTRGAD